MPYRSAPTRFSFLTLFAAAVSFLVFAALSSAEMLPAERIADQLGMSEEAKARVLKGEVVVEKLEPSSDKDLSLALVAAVDAPLEKVSEFLQSGRFIEISNVTLAVGEIDTTTFSMESLELPEEVLKQLVDDPEDSFHLSEEEASRVAEAARKGSTETLAAYRAVLSARARAYWEEGIPGIEPYQGKGRSPGEDLTHANDAARKFIQNKNILAELEAVPSKSPGRAEHSLYWAVQKGRDRIAPVLNHRILYTSNDGQVAIERRFYSGYDYDALQITTGILPVSEMRCAVFYLNHTYTSQVAGFGGSAKRSIGRSLMTDELVAEMERAQELVR